VLVDVTATALTTTSPAPRTAPGLSAHGAGSIKRATAQATITTKIDIAASLQDLDGSEALSVIIAGVPSGGALSAGQEVRRNLALAADDLR
jgi:hypothetical protein